MEVIAKAIKANLSLRMMHQNLRRLVAGGSRVFSRSDWRVCSVATKDLG
jgi:hypothetical protein